jgi:hypothetical protein
MSNNTAGTYIAKPNIGAPVDRRNFLKLAAQESLRG